jgi:hypothetical protein
MLSQGESAIVTSNELNSNGYLAILIVCVLSKDAKELSASSEKVRETGTLTHICATSGEGTIRAVIEVMSPIIKTISNGSARSGRSGSRGRGGGRGNYNGNKQSSCQLKCLPGAWRT